MEYKVIGEPMPVVQCDLRAGEALKVQSGGMVWMSPNMKMETNAGGGLGKALGRMFSGEAVFENLYVAEGGPGMITLGSSFTGSIRAIQITPDKPIICQRGAFLACEKGVELSVFFQKKLGAGFLGGEGFIMQKLSGNGIALLEIDGYAVEYELAERQSMLLEPGCLAMMDETCSMDIERVKGVKNVLFGGEGMFITKMTGPGKIVLQTMPISSFAQALIPFFPKENTNGNQ